MPNKLAPTSQRTPVNKTAYSVRCIQIKASMLIFGGPKLEKGAFTVLMHILLLDMSN